MLHDPFGTFSPYTCKTKIKYNAEGGVESGLVGWNSPSLSLSLATLEKIQNVSQARYVSEFVYDSCYFYIYFLIVTHDGDPRCCHPLSPSNGQLPAGNPTATDAYMTASLSRARSVTTI